MKKGSHKREATCKVSQKEVQTFRNVSSYFMEVQFVIMIMGIKKISSCCLTHFLTWILGQFKKLSLSVFKYFLMTKRSSLFLKQIILALVIFLKETYFIQFYRYRSNTGLYLLACGRLWKSSRWTPHLHFPPEPSAAYCEWAGARGQTALQVRISGPADWP